MVESTASGGLRPEVEQVARDINKQVMVWIGQERSPDPERVREVAGEWVRRLGRLDVDGRPQRWYASPVSGELAGRFHATYLASDDPLLKAVARQVVQPGHLGELEQVWQSERLRQVDALGRGAREAPEPAGQEAVDRVHARTRADNHPSWTLPTETAGILREQLFAVARQGSDVIRVGLVDGTLTAADVAMVASTVMIEANSVRSAGATLARLAETPQPPAPSPAESEAVRVERTKANLARLVVIGNPRSLEAMRLAVRDVPTRFGGSDANVPPTPPRRASSPGADHLSLDHAREDTLVNRIRLVADPAEREALLDLVRPHINLEEVPLQSAEIGPVPVPAEAVEFVRARLEVQLVGLSKWSEMMSSQQLVAETAPLAALTRHALTQVSTLNAATGNGPAAHQVAAVAIGPSVRPDSSGTRQEESQFPVGGRSVPQAGRDVPGRTSGQG